MNSSTAELRKTKFAKCIDCALVSCEQNMFLSNQTRVLVGRRQEMEIQIALRFRALHSLGCERYECPIFFDNKNDNIVTSLQASFNPAFPDVTTLLGSYDIVYAFSDWGSVVDGKPRYKQRICSWATQPYMSSLGKHGKQRALRGC